MASTAPVESDVRSPPDGLRSRNPLGWLRFFGPGAIIASVTIGSGELIFPSRGGALFGYQLLWIFPLCVFLKWTMVYGGMRHMILSGAHPLERWTWLPGPRGWVPLSMCVLVFICLPMIFSFMSGILGTHCAAVTGFGNQSTWATLWAVVAIVMLLTGGYNFVEKSQIVILGLMLIGVFMAVVWVQPDWSAVIRGFFLPRPLSYPDWAYQVLPDLRNRAIWVELTMYIWFIGGAGEDYLSYASLLREKKWGMSHLQTAGREQLARIAERRDHPARIWVRAALIDTVTSFTSVVLIATVFAILGAVILHPDHLIPADEDLLTYQAKFLTELSPWLTHFYNLAVFLAFFGILLGGPELSFRLLYEYLHTLPRYRNSLAEKKLRIGAILWTLGTGILLLWVVKMLQDRKIVSNDLNLLDILTPAGIYTGSLGCAVFCLANVWADRRFLPAALRSPWPLTASNIGAGVVFLLMSIKAIWDYDGVRGLVIICGLLAGCMLLARLLRFVYDEPIRNHKPSSLH